MSGAKVSEGTVSKNSPDINLKDGQTATVYGLPPETEYTVTESAVSGFTSQSDGATGTIKVGKTSVAAFTNTYNVTPVTFPANGNFSGIKRLEGRKWANGDSFTFIINNYNNAPLPDKSTVTVTKPDTTGGTDATFEFGAIEFTKPGVYRYTIYEQEPENDHYLNGMSYSSALYRLVVTVVDNGDGTLSVDTANTEIQKLYKDDAIPLFTYDNNNQIVMNAGEEAPDDVVFVNTFEAGSVIRVPAALKDYTDNSGQNSLVSGMFSFKFEAVGYSVDGGAFVNDKSKVPMPEGAVNGAVITENEGRNITFESVEFKQSDIPAGADSITFRYNMSEVVPANKIHGMDYDDTVYTINVTVSVDAESGTLVVNSVYPNNERVVTFKNEYTPDPVTADILGTKTLNGRDMKNGEFEFTIMGGDAATNLAIRNGEVIIPDDTVSAPAASDGVAGGFTFDDIKFTKAGTYTFTVSEAEGQIPAITYDKNTVNVTVIIYDENKDGKLEVKSVTYSNGKSQAEFTNTYTANFVGTGVSLAGEKQLTGKTLLEGEFFFNVVQYVDGVKVGEGLVTHAKDTDADTNDVYSGAITFLNDVKYTAAGVYEYIISEQIPDDANKVGGTTYDTTSYRYTVTELPSSIAGITNDNKPVTVTVEVDYDSVQGELSYTVKYEKDGKVGKTFVNTYKAAASEPVSITATKKVTASDGNTYKLESGKFWFTIEGSTGAPMPSVTRVTCDENGNIDFGEIVFTTKGDYEYTIREEAGNIGQMTYDGAVYTFKVKVTNNVTIGKLETETSLKKDNANANAIVFTNDYNPKKTSAVIFGKKTLDSEHKDIESGEFKFKLSAVSAGTPMPDQNTVTNTASGAFQFGTIEYTKVGVYKYTVTEVDLDKYGYEYDGKSYDITVTVTDDNNGQLVSSVDGIGTLNAPTVQFVNKYAPDPVEVTIGDKGELVKDLDGRDMNDKEFEFVLTDSNDVEIGTAKNNKKGEFEFTFEITKAGTHKYTLTEKDNGLGGVSYDKRTYDVTVEVVDKDGKLEVRDVKFALENAPKDKVVFENTYTAEKTHIILKAVKTLKNRTLKSGEFKFILKDKDGKVVSTAVNDENGDITFDRIEYTEKGEYKYTVTEEIGTLDGITYDRSEYAVNVEVTDDGKGKLGVSKTVITKAGKDVESITFENTYKPIEIPEKPELPKAGDDANLGLWLALFFISGGVLVGAGVYTARSRKNK